MLIKKKLTPPEYIRGFRYTFRKIYLISITINIYAIDFIKIIQETINLVNTHPYVPNSDIPIMCTSK